MQPLASMSGMREPSSRRATSSTRPVLSVGLDKVWDTVERVKSSNRSRTVTVLPGRSAARRRRVTRSTTPTEHAVEVGGGVRAAADGVLGAHGTATASCLDPAGVAVVGERVQVARGGGPDQGHQLAPFERGDLADGVQADGVQLLRRDRTDAPQPFDR